jgi:hypothetical protein
MFVHEYSCEEFETYEECLEDLSKYFDEDDIIPHLEIKLEKVVSVFLRNDIKTFASWFQQQLDGAITLAQDELITEYEEGDVGDE